MHSCLCLASRTERFPIDFELYLPRSWLNDPLRRAKVRIPPDRVFKTKIELALNMMDRTTQANIPGDVVLADCSYSESVKLCGEPYGYWGSTMAWVCKHP